MQTTYAHVKQKQVDKAVVMTETRSIVTLTLAIAPEVPAITFI